MSVINLEQEKQKLLAPLKELHKTSVREVERLQLQLTAARKTKSEIEKLLRGVDPSFHNPYAKNGQKGQSKSTLHRYGPDRVEAATAWFQAHGEELNARNEGVGFYATEISEAYEDVPVKSQSGIAKMLLQLHEAGIVRLVKTGGMGGRKYYKVVV